MEYNFRDIEKKWQEWWKENKIYQVPNNSPKLKCYVLDMFPYPSGAGLHVGHPLGYIASDIFARYKRLKGFNVLHPMGFDAFGLPAEQYAIEHGIHPAVSTKNNIENFKKQLDNIGFCFDWSREIQTCDPKYYKWTQWIFLKLFNSFFNRNTKKAEPIENLIAEFEKEGNKNHPVPDAKFEERNEVFENLNGKFSAEQWKEFDEKTKQDVLMEYRLAYCGYGEVNWCEALGTVLANDEVVNGVSERGGYPVVKKKLRQWYLRITEYADRLLEGLQKVDFSEAMKEMQTNWIGKSEGAEIEFRIKAPSQPSPKGKENESAVPRYQTAQLSLYDITKKLAQEKRNNPTHEELLMWERLRNNQTGFHIRRQHIIGSYIVDFACLDKLVTIEIDGGYHNNSEIKEYDEQRTKFLKENGFTELRYSNEEVRKDANSVIENIVRRLKELPSVPKKDFDQVLPSGEDLGGAFIRVYTTRPDTIFGVDFLVLAPEHELVETITTAEQKKPVEEYLEYVKSRNERERMAEKKITGVFTGAYAIHPFSGKEIPIWVSEYVLIGYGTGAIMAVPCGDERDHKFAKHFGIEITNIIGKYYNGEEANPTKDAVLENSDFLNGMIMKDAIPFVIKKIEEMGIGERKVNYKMRDAAFSRQRYWGEPIPIVWEDGIAYPLSEEELPLELPHVETYKPGPEGEGPLANIKEWALIPSPSPQAEKGAMGAANVPKYSVHSPNQYELAKQMRKEHTEAENILWQALRSHQLDAKFRRQHPIEAYIVDFISLQNKLIIEVDGGYHENQEQKKYDELRTKTLREIGFSVIRFSNDEVKNNLTKTLEQIKKELKHLSSPLSTGGEGLGVRETNTMPGYAGSSWYFLRYMDPHDDKTFCERKISDYWNQVDLYIGGTEHAVGHLLYSRMWTKVLNDLNLVGFDEPYRKLVNQGMIQGSSRFVYRYVWKINYDKEKAKQYYSSIGESSFNDDRISKELLPLVMNDIAAQPVFISKNYLEDLNKNKTERGVFLDKLKKVLFERLKKRQSKLLNIGVYVEDYEFEISVNELHVDVNIVDGVELNIEEFRKWRNGEYKDAILICEDGSINSPLSTNGEGQGVRYICGTEVEKMSKSKFNTVNPDDIVNKYGADTFRMYEMFLGPVEMSKPWDTKGIEGVHRFLKKFWRLFADEEKGLIVTDEPATTEELKVLHKTIKKIEEDTERFSFNTAVSSFMIATNELTDLKCRKRSVLEPLLILLSPYAPHICEELWRQLGHTTTILDENFPAFEEKYVKESSKTYPIAINGKPRTEINIALDATQKQVEEIVLQDEIVKKWLEGKPPKKLIYVKGKMINLVV